MMGYPRFSSAEMGRRHHAIESVMGEAGVDHLVVYGAHREGSAVQWLCGWPVTREAALVVSPREQMVLFVQFYNHVPNARELAPDVDVRWGGVDTFGSVAEELSRRNASRVGLIGPVGYRGFAQISALCEPVSMDDAYRGLRNVKSAEEISWLRHGVRQSDAAVEAIRHDASPGTSETELAAIVEAAYLDSGATNHIHYFSATSMTAPERVVPAQWPSGRKLAVGDVLTCEISASWWGYPGQILRTMTVAAEPTEAVSTLHAVAEEAFDQVFNTLRHGAMAAEVVDAASAVIDDSGFTIYDDLLHGFVGGYWPPVLGTHSRANEPVPEMSFQAGMTVVIQPNVILLDTPLGVQTGELVLVSEQGAERLHDVDRGLWRIS